MCGDSRERMLRRQLQKTTRGRLRRRRSVRTTDTVGMCWTCPGQRSVLHDSTPINADGRVPLTTRWLQGGQTRKKMPKKFPKDRYDVGFTCVFRLVSLVSSLFSDMIRTPYRPWRGEVSCPPERGTLLVHSFFFFFFCNLQNYFLLSSSMDKTVRYVASFMSCLVRIIGPVQRNLASKCVISFVLHGRLWHISRSECLCCFQHIDFVTAIVFHPRVSPQLTLSLCALSTRNATKLSGGFSKYWRRQKATCGRLSRKQATQWWQIRVHSSADSWNVLSSTLPRMVRDDQVHARQGKRPCEHVRRPTWETAGQQVSKLGPARAHPRLHQLVVNAS